MKKFIVFLLVICFCRKSFGQEDKKESDSTKQDSIGFYEKIENYSQKRKLTKVLHQWIFRGKKPKKNKHEKAAPSPDYTPYSGKVIRNIIIRTKDPFGYAINDTTEKPDKWLEKTGNHIHIKSKDMAIRKYLLIEKGQTLDTLLIEETARLLRKQDYIRRVGVFPKPIGPNSDSLDIFVEVLDSWSLIPKGSFSDSRTKLGLRERNFFGTGHRLNLRYAKRYQDGNTGYEMIYTVPNIQNSFINATGKYAYDLDSYYDHFFAINREFYSPLARWAGGAFVQKRFLNRPFPNGSAEFIEQDFKFLYHDYWAAYAFKVFEGKSKEERSTNLIVGLRSYFLNYEESPASIYDEINYFSDERFYLASLGLASRQFAKDRFIFRDGETEDVPIGSLYSFTTGVQRKNQNNRLYMGVRASYGNYFDWGFLSGNIELGSFFEATQPEQTALSFKANYFSNLLTLGRGWKMRQFVKPQIVLGFNRLNSVGDRLGLNENAYFSGVNSYEYVDYYNKHKYVDYRNGNINGFRSEATGTKKYVVDFQTQFYSPWNFLGFRFNPFVHASFGVLTGGDHSYASNKLYSSYGAGFIIRNDYLVFDSFQLSFSFYPSMPGQGRNIFSVNNFRSEDFGFQGFKFDEPRPVIYE